MRLRGERDRQQQKVDNLKRQQIDAPHAAAAIPTATAALEEARRAVATAPPSTAFTVRAPGGRHGPALRRVVPPHVEGELQSWSGRPLDPENQGCYLQTGTLVCQVGDPDRWEAVLLVPEDEMEFCATGQSVRLLLDQMAGEPLTGKIVALAEIDADDPPIELVDAGLCPPRRGQRPRNAGWQPTIRPAWPWTRRGKR